MILDVRYHDKGPEQFSGVRLTTIYLEPDFKAPPEMVFHFYDPRNPTISIPLADIKHISVTND